MKGKTTESTMASKAVSANSGESKNTLAVSRGRALRIFIAAVFSFLGAILLIAETYTVIIWFIPWISIQMFQAVGISIADGLTFSEFSVGDTVVLLMMWGLPSLMMTLLVSFCQWTIIKSVFKVFRKLWYNARHKDYDTSSTES